jgi:hypothetical protein
MERQEQEMSEPTIGSSLILPGDSGIYGFKLWVVVPANTSDGVYIDALRKGDQVIVNQNRNLNGMAAFTDTSMPKVDGIVGLANYASNGGLLYADQNAATPFVNAWNGAFAMIEKAVHKNSEDHKLRNPFGRDPGGDHQYQLEEGGVILCMPEAAGPIYSNADTQPLSGSRDNGRLPKYWPTQVTELNSGFLYKDSDSPIIATATRSGGLCVIAFDQAQAYDDNNGAYAMEIIIVRAADSAAGQSAAQIFQTLDQAAPTSGIGDLGLND